MSATSGIENYLFGGVVLLFVALLLVEKYFPYLKTPSSELKQSFSTNTSAFLINNVIMSALSLSSLLVVAANYSNHGLLSGVEDGPLKWLLSFILFDFAVYVWHLLGHKNEFLWRFHKIHHSDKSFHVTTGLRFHVFDQFLELLFKCFCTVIFGVPAKVVVLCEVTRMFFVLFHHANTSFPGEKWLSRLIITPSLHRAHHSTLRSEHDSNYGIVLAIWDLLFRTRKELVPKRIGLDVIEAENIVQLFSLAFVTERRFARLLHLLPRGKAKP
ncbi:MAG: sterol desaturase family protein [Methylocystis sp.]|jgi:sterol desaturase/sphingolipid hydroxylase (fatty acid hydroxylase superfamily)